MKATKKDYQKKALIEVSRRNGYSLKGSTVSNNGTDILSKEDGRGTPSVKRFIFKNSTGKKIAGKFNEQAGNFLSGVDFLESLTAIRKDKKLTEKLIASLTSGKRNFESGNLPRLLKNEIERKETLRYFLPA